MKNKLNKILLACAATIATAAPTIVVATGCHSNTAKAKIEYSEIEKTKTTATAVETCTYKFAINSDETNITPELTTTSASTDVEVRVVSFNISNKIGILTVKLININEWALINGDYASFDIKFKGENWEETIEGFKLTYKAAISCENSKILTAAGTAVGTLTLNDEIDLPTGWTYDFEIVRLSQYKGVKATLGTPTIKSKKIEIPVTMTKEGSEGLGGTDFCIFDILITKKDSKEAGSYYQRINNIRITYNGGKLSWADGWYSSEMVRDSKGKAWSKRTDVTFTLENALASGQSLTAEYELVDTESTVNRTIEADAVKVSGTDVTIPLSMVSTSSSFLYFGDHIVYNVTFKCTDTSGTVIWTQKLKYLYLYLFADFTIANSEKTKTTKSQTDILVSHTISISKTYTGFTFKTEIDNIKTYGGLPTTAKVEPVNSIQYVSLETSKQTVKWSDTTGFVEGGYVTYDMHVTVTCNKYPDYPVKFDYTDLRLNYA